MLPLLSLQDRLSLTVRPQGHFSLASAHSVATQGQSSYNPCPHPAQSGERTLPVLVPLAGRDHFPLLGQQGFSEGLGEDYNRYIGQKCSS